MNENIFDLEKYIDSATYSDGHASLLWSDILKDFLLLDVPVMVGVLSSLSMSQIKRVISISSQAKDKIKEREMSFIGQSISELDMGDQEIANLIKTLLNKRASIENANAIDWNLTLNDRVEQSENILEGEHTRKENSIFIEDFTNGKVCFSNKNAGRYFSFGIIGVKSGNPSDNIVDSILENRCKDTNLRGDYISYICGLIGYSKINDFKAAIIGNEVLKYFDKFDRKLFPSTLASFKKRKNKTESNPLPKEMIESLGLPPIEERLSEFAAKFDLTQEQYIHHISLERDSVVSGNLFKAIQGQLNDTNPVSHHNKKVSSQKPPHGRESRTQTLKSLADLEFANINTVNYDALMREKSLKEDYVPEEILAEMDGQLNYLKN